MLTLNKDHQLTKYETISNMDYGDGLVTDFHTIYTIEQKGRGYEVKDGYAEFSIDHCSIYFYHRSC